MARTAGKSPSVDEGGERGETSGRTSYERSGREAREEVLPGQRREKRKGGPGRGRGGGGKFYVQCPLETAAALTEGGKGGRLQPADRDDNSLDTSQEGWVGTLFQKRKESLRKERTRQLIDHIIFCEVKKKEGGHLLQMKRKEKKKGKSFMEGLNPTTS